MVQCGLKLGLKVSLINVATPLGRGYTELFKKLAVFHASFLSGYTGGKEAKRLKNRGFLQFPSSISKGF